MDWKFKCFDDRTRLEGQRAYSSEEECRRAVQLDLRERSYRLSDLEVVGPETILRGEAVIAWARG